GAGRESRPETGAPRRRRGDRRARLPDRRARSAARRHAAPARRRRRLPPRGGRGVAAAARPCAPPPRRLRPRPRDGGARGGVRAVSVTPLPRDPEDEQRERAPRRSPPPAPGRAPSLLDSFNYALEGVIHVLRTQRNLRIHFLAAVLVFGGAIAVGVSRLQLMALFLVVLLVIATKAWTGRGTPLRGGLPSGHAALAFAGWIAITYLVGDQHRFVVSSLTLIMALLVAQTRVESGIHSVLEVTYGG